MVSAAMLQFIIQNWERDKKPVIWFNRPTDNKKYHTGRSWEENMGLSVEDIKYGLGYIGTRITKKSIREDVLKETRPLFDLKGRMVNANKLVLYYRIDGVPYYELNVILAAKAVELQLSGEWQNHLAPLSDAMRELEPKEPRLRVDASEISSFKDFIMPEISSKFALEEEQKDGE